MIDSNELIRATGAPYWMVEYLIRLKIIKAVRRGKGTPRIYPKNSIKKVLRYMKRRGIESGT